MRIDGVFVGIPAHHCCYGNFVAYALAQAALAQASQADILLRLCFHLDTDEIAAMLSQEANDLNYLIFHFILPRCRELDSQRLLVWPVLAHSLEYLKREM